MLRKLKKRIKAFFHSVISNGIKTQTDAISNGIATQTSNISSHIGTHTDMVTNSIATQTSNISTHMGTHTDMVSNGLATLAEQNNRLCMEIQKAVHLLENIQTANALYGQYMKDRFENECVAFSPERYIRTQALQESCQLISEHLDTAMLFSSANYSDTLKVLRYTLNYVSIDGAFVECGVFNGKSIRVIAEKYPERKVFGFDSFEGLPEDWVAHRGKGSYASNGIPDVPKNVTLVKGWFDDTLPVFSQENCDLVIALIHIDSDLYSSAKVIFKSLVSHFRPGTIMVFDEFYNYPNWKHHEYKAFMEFVDETQLKYTFLAFGQQQVGLRIDSITVPEQS